MTVADRVDAILQERGLSRRQLAIKAGIPPSSLQSAMERGHNITLDMLQKIAEALGTSVFSLMEVDETELSAFVQNIDQSLLSLIKADYSTDTEFYKDFFDKKISLAVLNSEEDRRLVTAYHKLNEEGQKKAVERVEELAKIPDYQKPKPPK